MMRPVATVMAQGLGFVCAHCDGHWHSVDRGLAGCRAHQEHKPCGGPLAKMSFPEYKGPLTGQMINYCFVCGSEPSAAVEVIADGGTRLGICETHLPMLDTYSRPGERPPFVRKSERRLPLLRH